MIEIEVPSGVQVEIKGSTVTVKGSLGSNERKFNDSLMSVEKQGNKVVIKPVEHDALKRKAMWAEKSMAKEIRNDIDGVMKHYEINMQMVFAHFPATAEVKGSAVHIKNLIGERGVRVANIVGNTKVEVKGNNLRLYGTSLDNVSQTAANLRTCTKIRRKDSRVFQDGVYYAME